MAMNSARFAETRIGIIGLGNVGCALGIGLRQAGHEGLTCGCDHNHEKRERFARSTGIRSVEDCTEVVEFADVILVCVRHDQVLPLLDRIRTVERRPPLVVSLAAGLPLASLRRRLAVPIMPVMRAVTNVNVASRAGLTIVLNDGDASAEGAALVVDVFRALGDVIAVESEAALDRISILSGCGPAAAIIFFEALIQFGVDAGLGAGVAKDAALLCVSGSLKTIENLGVDLKTLKDSVAAPGGIVQALLASTESEQIQRAVTEWFSYVLERIDGGVS